MSTEGPPGAVRPRREPSDGASSASPPLCPQQRNSANLAAVTSHRQRDASRSPPACENKLAPQKTVIPSNMGPLLGAIFIRQTVCSLYFRICSSFYFFLNFPRPPPPPLSLSPQEAKSTTGAPKPVQRRGKPPWPHLCGWLGRTPASDSESSAGARHRKRGGEHRAGGPGTEPCLWHHPPHRRWVCRAPGVGARERGAPKQPSTPRPYPDRCPSIPASPPSIQPGLTVRHPHGGARGLGLILPVVLSPHHAANPTRSLAAWGTPGMQNFPAPSLPGSHRQHQRGTGRPRQGRGPRRSRL